MGFGGAGGVPVGEFVFANFDGAFGKVVAAIGLLEAAFRVGASGFVMEDAKEGGEF